jgi:hypothetical protein
MPALPLGPIADRARTAPDDLALLDSATSRTWAQVSAELAIVATAMLEAAPETHQRWGVLGDNTLHTLVGHSAGPVRTPLTELDAAELETLKGLIEANR